MLALFLTATALPACGDGSEEFEVEVRTNCTNDGAEVDDTFVLYAFDCTDEDGCDGWVSTGDVASGEEEYPYSFYVMYRSFPDSKGGDNYLFYPTGDSWDGRCDIALEELGSEVLCTNPSGIACTVRIDELTEGVRE